MKPTMSRNAVPERHREDGERALARLLEQRRRDALEHEVDADPERADPALVELLDQRLLGGDAALEAHPRGQHHPAALEEAGRLLDVDAVRAGDLAVERTRAPAQQREPEVLLGDEVTEDQRRRGGLHAPGV